MKKYLLLMMIMLPFSVFSQNETYSITGRVNVFGRKGDVHIFLVNEDTFKENPWSGIDTLVFPVNMNKTSIEYKFNNVPPGTYALSCFQDVNGNKKFDKFLSLPFEPWAFSFSNEVRFPPGFGDISFEIMYDYRINMQMGK